MSDKDNVAIAEVAEAADGSITVKAHKTLYRVPEAKEKPDVSGLEEVREGEVLEPGTYIDEDGAVTCVT